MRISWVKISDCRSVKVPVNLDDSTPKKMTFEEYISQFSDTEQKSVFGEVAIKAYRRGEITPHELISQDDCMMKLKLLMENW